MPISTIADALQSVGGNISEVLKQEGLRRQQALEAQAQTNELQVKQGLLGLEAQKATAAGELGLAKAGAEARTQEVISRQRDTELAQQEWLHREQVKNAAEQTRITRQHYAMVDPAAVAASSAQAGYSTALAGATLANTPTQPEIDARAKAAKLKVDADELTLNLAQRKYTQDTEPMALEPYFHAMTKDMPPEQKATAQAFLDTAIGNSHTFKLNPTTGYHEGTWGDFKAQTEFTQTFMKGLAKQGQETPHERATLIKDLVDLGIKNNYTTLPPEDYSTIIAAQHDHNTQWQPVAQDIATHRTAALAQAKKDWITKRYGGKDPGELVLEKDEGYQAMLNKGLKPLFERKTLEAARQILQSRGTTAPTMNWGDTPAPAAGGTTPPPAPSPAPVAQLSPSQQQKTEQVAQHLQTPPGALQQSIHFETGGTMSPSTRNPLPNSTATGLIQFTEATANRLGTTTDALAKMSYEQQMDYVERYLAPFKGRLKTAGDIELALIAPNHVGDPPDTILFAKGSKEYAGNARAFDPGGKGYITVQDVQSRVQNRGVIAQVGQAAQLDREFNDYNSRTDPLLQLPEDARQQYRTLRQRGLPTGTAWLQVRRERGQQAGAR